MPGFNRVAKIVAKPIPRVLSPQAHAAVDCMRIALFVASAGWFWRRRKRAAIAALVCASAEGALALLTNYQTGSGKIFSFNTHREIDLGLASMAAAMPAFLGFENDAAKNLFLAQGALSTAVLEVTRFTETGRTGKKSPRYLAA